MSDVLTKVRYSAEILMRQDFGGTDSPYARLRELIAIPREEQLKAIKLAAGLINQSVDLQMIVPPASRLDLRFTYGTAIMEDRPIDALLVCAVLDKKIQPKELMLNIEHGNIAILFIHEIAHYYDLHCFEPPRMFSSHIDEVFRDWRSTVNRTNSFRVHKAIIGSLTGKFVSDVLDRKGGQGGVIEQIYDERLCQSIYIEAFARCFCQWIVRQWEQKGLAEAELIIDLFREERESQLAMDFYLYWDDEEMELLDSVMGELFQRS